MLQACLERGKSIRNGCEANNEIEGKTHYYVGIGLRGWRKLARGDGGQIRESEKLSLETLRPGVAHNPTKLTRVVSNKGLGGVSKL